MPCVVDSRAETNDVRMVDAHVGAFQERDVETATAHFSHLSAGRDSNRCCTAFDTSKISGPYGPLVFLDNGRVRTMMPGRQLVSDNQHYPAVRPTPQGSPERRQNMSSLEHAFEASGRFDAFACLTPRKFSTAVTA
jgi:hypothetical protein